MCINLIKLWKISCLKSFQEKANVKSFCHSWQHTVNIWLISLKYKHSYKKELVHAHIHKWKTHAKSELSKNICFVFTNLSLTIPALLWPPTKLKGNRTEDTHRTWKCRKCVHVSIYRLHLDKRRTFLLQIWALCGASMASSLPMKSRKRLAQDILDTFATHAHATDRLLDAKYQHSRSCLQLSNADLLTNRIQNWVKSMCVYYCCSIPTDKACATSSAWFPFKLGSYLLMMWSLETVLTAGEIEGKRRRARKKRKGGVVLTSRLWLHITYYFFPMWTKVTGIILDVVW